MRQQAEQSMQGYVSQYEVTITRDAYGNETYHSGLLNTYPCYFGKITGTDNEVVKSLITEGKIKGRVGMCLMPYSATINQDTVYVFSGSIAGEEWVEIWNNQETLPEYRIYTKLILTQKDKHTKYKDTIK